MGFHRSLDASLIRPRSGDDGYLRRSEAGYVSDAAEDSVSRPSAFDRPRCHFEVFRADEVSVTSTRHVGGDWRWRLSDQDGQVLVEAGGYPSEASCREAVEVLHSRAGFATVS